MEKNYGYNVVIGDFKIEYNARLVEREARKHGLNAKTHKMLGKYYVNAGFFTEEKEAKKVLAATKGKGYVFSYLKKSVILEE